jgi:predicted ATPase/DNA-binding SARP family transcriptional activator
MEVTADDGTPVAVPGAKLRALLAMLALDCGHVVATDRLIDDLWRDDQPADPTNALQRLVSKLRRTLGSNDVVALQPPGYVLALPSDSVDVYRFERLLADGRAAIAAGDLDTGVERLRAAESSWNGNALADFVYEEFAQPHVARLDEARVSAIEDRVDAELAIGRHGSLSTELATLVGEHPLRERLRGQLAVALYRTGRQADALRILHEGRRALADELGLDPGPELQRLETAILDHDPALLVPVATPAQVTAPAPAAAPKRRTNVKAAVSPLVGRDDELDRIGKLLDGHRLVTLVGPGGAGKTRLAIETARAAAATDAHADGVFVVELAPVRDADAVAGAIADVLDLPASNLDPLSRVREFCDGRDLLLVLDNCEHLVAAAAEIAADLLGASAGLRLLTTRREALRVDGEAVWVVPPLVDIDAVDLFVQRATTVDARFEADDATRAVIGDICRRLDGLPLAIELAAGRTRVFPVAQIAERLDDRFRLLTGGSRTAMARQQTLRAVVDWSYDLLFEDERRVFERLSVLPGGCTMATALAVCVADDVDADDVVEVIAGLVEKSLVYVDTSGVEPRYRMLQTLGQYGREKLVERGEADTVFARMANDMAALCARSREACRGIAQREWFLAVGVEQDNIRTAFDWAVGVGDKELALSIAADLTFHRWVAGGAGDGYHWIDVALALPGDVDPFTLGRGLVWHAFLGFLAGHVTRVDDGFDAGLELLRAHADDPVLVVYVLSFYSQVVGATGRPEKAAAINAAALELVETATSDPWARAARTWLRAALAVQLDADFDAFDSLLREALVQYRDAGDLFMTAVCLDIVAEFDEFRGDVAGAAEALRDALDIVGGFRMTLFETTLMARLGTDAAQAGDAAAEQLVDAALARANELSYRPARAQALNALAGLRRRQHRLDDAAALAREALDLQRSPSSRRFSASFSRAPTPFDIPAGMATSMSVLGFVAEARGDVAEAIEWHQAAYEQVRGIGHSRLVPLALEGLAGAAVLDGDASWAADLLGAAANVRSWRHAAPTPAEQRDVDRIRDAAATLLGPAVFAARFEQGRHTAPDQLVAGSPSTSTSLTGPAGTAGSGRSRG